MARNAAYSLGVPELLARYDRRQQELEDARRIGRIIEETGEGSRRRAGNHSERRRPRPSAAQRTTGCREQRVRRHPRHRSARRCPTCGERATPALAETRAPKRPLEVEHRPQPEMTPAEREKYRRWWLEESGLTRRELREIAVALTKT
jgi:hypothetical protein